jgi:hypothetical protein
MATNDEQVGRASGYAVEEDEQNGGFSWSAYGPNGTRQGHAESRADAEAAARGAERELTRYPSAS